MKHNTLVLALVAAATGMPGTVQAADDVCSRLFIYAVNQICQLLPNGQSLCQPVGLAGPSPTCQTPGQPAMMQVPLGPPAIQFPAFNPAANTYNPNPYVQNSFAMNPYGVNSNTANPYAANPFGMAPFPFAPGAFPPAVNYTPPQFPPFPQFAAPSAPVAPQIASQQTQAASADTPPPAMPSAPILTKLMPEAGAQPTPAAQPVAESSPANQPASPATAVASTTAAPTVVPVTQSVATPAATAVLPVATVPEAAPGVAQATANVDVPKADVGTADAAATRAAQAAAEKAHQDALAHFDFDSAELTPVGRAMLDEWLAQASSKTPILVTGHADRLGPEPYNGKLSQLRAESVKKYLVEKGMPATRIQILAKGEHMPLISCAGDANPETKSCLAPNRRAEVAVKPASKSVEKAAVKTVVKNAKATAKKPAKIKHITQK